MNEPFTAEAYLKAAGITPTLQRTIVMDDLYHNRTHATIYNTINLFVAKGLVSELTIDEKCAHYDFDTSVHTHFQCTDCGTIFDVHSTRMRYRLPRGFTLQTEQHCTYGICAACNRKRMQYKL